MGLALREIYWPEDTFNGRSCMQQWRHHILNITTARCRDLNNFDHTVRYDGDDTRDPGRVRTQCLHRLNEACPVHSSLDALKVNESPTLRARPDVGRKTVVTEDIVSSHGKNENSCRSLPVPGFITRLTSPVERFCIPITCCLSTRRGDDSVNVCATWGWVPCTRANCC
jgi:hypothetical protein